MNKSRAPLIIVIIVAAICLLYFFSGDGDSALKYQWQESYKAESNQPYGTSIIRDVLQFEAKDKFVYNKSTPLKKLLENPGSFSNCTYVLIGQSVHLDDTDIDALLEFINSGNDVFMSTLEAPAQLVGMIHYDCESELTYESKFARTVKTNFFNSSFKKADGYDYTFRFGREDEFYHWYSVYPFHFCDSAKMAVPLGYQDADEVNFIKLPHGAGNLYLHTNPLTFTNYFMIQPEKVEYASTAFSHLRNRKSVIWDEYSKIPFAGNQNSYNSPLYYIMQQPSLKYAWWLLLITIGLYVLFAAKRAQRPIPVLEVKSNTSLEFVKMVSSLHYLNGNHMDMAKKKMKYFLYFVRSKYGIQETTFTSDTITKLSEKSKVDRTYIADIINQYNSIEGMQFNILPATLTSFFDAVEKFYKHCK